MNAAPSLLVQMLREPANMAGLPPSGWDLLVRQARRSDLLARLYVLVRRCEMPGVVPAGALGHLESAYLLAEAQRRAVRWEVDQIRRALAAIGVPVILLKGAAYTISEHPAGEGRLYSDIDILVPKHRLEAVERALFARGWISTHDDAYDQRYYRQWMHELPPLRHMRRQTILDVHHGILPETARLHPDPRKLISAARAVAGNGALLVLAPMDMLLHSATHLFFDGELERGLRDLVDIDVMLRDFSARDDLFWSGLVARARELDLLRPLYYALRYSRRVLGTPIPAEVREAARAGRPSGFVVRLMDALFGRALAPDHPSCDDPLTGVARWLLYVRAHKLRMPLYLLIPHLTRKAVKRRFATREGMA